MKKFISLALTLEPNNTVKTSVFKFRTKHKWIFQLIYGTANDEEIFDNILKRIQDKIDILVVHSSFNDMLPMYTGNLNKLLKLILTYCAENNITLVMPTFFLGSNSKAKEHYLHGRNVFDVNKTISGMGMLTEIFRRKPGVKRSIHPTHSVCAFGPLADEMVNYHHKAETTFGEGSPFIEMTKFKTIILGIGTQIHQALTQVHTAEDFMGQKYPIDLYAESIPVTCIDWEGNSLIYNLPIRKTEYYIEKKLVHKILRNTVNTWKFKGIPFLLTKADQVTETVVRAAQNGHTIYKKRD